jgi:hypothetical protein
VLETPVVVRVVEVATTDGVACVVVDVAPPVITVPPFVVPDVDDEVPDVDKTVVVAVCVTTVPVPPVVVVVPLPKTEVRILVAVLEDAKLPPNIPLVASVNVRVVPRLLVLASSEFVPDPCAPVGSPPPPPPPLPS